MRSANAAAYVATDDDVPLFNTPAPSQAVATTTAAPAAQDLALFVNAQAGLLELLSYREGLPLDPDITPADLAESLKACDEALQAYVAHELASVDNLAAHLREFETRESAMRAEAKRFSERARLWADRYERLRDAVKLAMEMAHRKRIEGKGATFAIKGNPPKTEVRQPDITPRRFAHVSVRVNAALWDQLQAVAMDLGDCPGDVAKVLTALSECTAGAITWELSQIKAAMKANGGVPGAVLVDDNTRLEVS